MKTPHGGTGVVAELAKPADPEKAGGVHESGRRNVGNGTLNGLDVAQVERQVAKLGVVEKRRPAAYAGDAPAIMQQSSDDRSAYA
jgi:hypothetical protein